MELEEKEDIAKQVRKSLKDTTGNLELESQFFDFFLLILMPKRSSDKNCTQCAQICTKLYNLPLITCTTQNILFSTQTVPN